LKGFTEEVMTLVIRVGIKQEEMGGEVHVCFTFVLERQ
jgi:hypothetical protein